MIRFITKKIEFTYSGFVRAINTTFEAFQEGGYIASNYYFIEEKLWQ